MLHCAHPGPPIGSEASIIHSHRICSIGEVGAFIFIKIIKITGMKINRAFRAHSSQFNLSMPQFPQELVEAFIECILIDGEHHTSQMPPLVSNTLLSCALVSKSFSAPARKHLFSSISPDPYQPSVQFKVDRILRSPEDITRRIKALGELLANEDSDLRRLITSLQLTVDEAQAIFNHSSGIQTTLQILLSTVCNLKTFKLTSALKPVLSWTNIRTEIRELLTTICHSPSIKSISFDHFSDLPVHLILGNPCIDSLWLVQTTFSNFPNAITTSSVEVATSTTIKRLNIALYLPEFWGNFSTEDRIFSGIEDFGTSIYTQTEVGIFKTVLERMHRSLKSLDLYVKALRWYIHTYLSVFYLQSFFGTNIRKSYPINRRAYLPSPPQHYLMPCSLRRMATNFNDQYIAEQMVHVSQRDQFANWDNENRYCCAIIPHT